MVVLQHAALHAQEQQIVWQQILMSLENTFGRFQCQISPSIKKRIKRNRKIDAPPKRLTAASSWLSPL
jgi:hypothetical protein